MEPDLGVTIDLINPDTYRIDPSVLLDPADEKLLEEEIQVPTSSRSSGWAQALNNSPAPPAPPGQRSGEQPSAACTARSALRGTAQHRLHRPVSAQGNSPALAVPHSCALRSLGTTSHSRDRKAKQAVVSSGWAQALNNSPAPPAPPGQRSGEQPSTACTARSALRGTAQRRLHRPVSAQGNSPALAVPHSCALGSLGTTSHSRDRKAKQAVVRGLCPVGTRLQGAGGPHLTPGSDT
ncbi:uncharacterized protein LOC141974160 [Athene noctua]|uniref:uncharacterized protein LOC141974160 n=1 Tax=Athene noctua TaxID=126797 RepID=UPI003EBB3994